MSLAEQQDETSEITTAHRAEFPSASSGAAGVPVALDRFYDVQVEISVEIGRATVSIGELMKLGKGSVLSLDRQLTEPVEILSKGVRIARGEIVVVDEKYAVRITEVQAS